VLISGVESVGGCVVVDYGVQTTPILHYLVKCANEPAYGEASVDAYYTMLAEAYVAFCGTDKGSTVWIDCANGVGAIAAKRLGDAVKETLDFSLFNFAVDDAGMLNENVCWDTDF
jgi:phosphoacetylglucosamine mutase